MWVIFPIVMFVVFIGVLASVYNEGLWSNAILLFNQLIAGLLAWNFFEPLSAKLGTTWPGEYFWDFLCCWAIFLLSMMLLQTATDAAAKIRVKFLKPVDVAGSYLFAAWSGWLLVCFVCATLHIAPLSRNMFFGAFRPEEKNLFGLAPDRKWLGFVQQMSMGPFRRITKADDQTYIFDRYGRFMPMYATRRGEYDKVDTFTGKK